MKPEYEWPLLRLDLWWEKDRRLTGVVVLLVGDAASETLDSSQGIFHFRLGLQ
jgi:hypothetical protein